MRLWSGSSPQFIEDNVRNQIAEKLKNAFFSYHRYNPSPNEIQSWRNSLRSLSITFQSAGLLDHGVMLEYQLPLTSQRLDCMICGRDENKKDNAVIVELKQWEKCQESHADNEVVTWVGGRLREVLHPSVQVGQYQKYLQDTQTAFYETDNPVQLNSCAYLHNYNFYKDDVIFSDKFKPVLRASPTFTADDTVSFEKYLKQKLEKGRGIDVLTRVENGRYRPSKKLMEHVSQVIKGNAQYVLLDEQLIVYDKVLACARDSYHDKQKTTLIIKGGPGTGKSVIALNLMADLLIGGYNSHYATGSKAFTGTLRKIIGQRGSAQFKYFNSYGQADTDSVDVMIADEAHRIRVTSNSRFTRREHRSNLPQIEEILKASKVSVFFIDDDQIVRPNEIGSVDYIKTTSEKFKSKVYEYELEAQFRCAGSDGFVNWINNTLGIKRTASILWDRSEKFDFEIMNSPQELEDSIRKKVSHGFTGRVAAGFCWKWSMPRADGTLIDDVVIGDYKRPWDAKPEATKLAPGIPKAELWAYDPNGIDQIGCVYTAQGFEFDYIGVIFGPDLVYDFKKQDWTGLKENSADSVVKRSKEQFVDLVKNTYRVLLTRGLKGCYVYFMDKSTEDFFRSRMEDSEKNVRIVSDRAIKTNSIEFDYEISVEKQFVTHLPVCSLKAAATAFSEAQAVEQLGWKKVDVKFRLNESYFIAQVVGKSMEPSIKDGDYCIFQKERGGSREGKVVLVECNRINDPENGQKYTVKRYHSEKELFDDGTWQHKKIILSPDNKSFEDIILENVAADDFKVIAEFVAAL